MAMRLKPIFKYICKCQGYQYTRSLEKYSSFFGLSHLQRTLAAPFASPLGYKPHDDLLDLLPFVRLNKSNYDKICDDFCI